MYKRVVLSGGGIKGIGYIGVLKALHEKEIVKNIEVLVGTSIGGFFALLIILNYTPAHLEKIFTEFNPQSLIEYKISTFLKILLMKLIL